MGTKGPEIRETFAWCHKRRTLTQYYDVTYDVVTVAFAQSALSNHVELELFFFFFFLIRTQKCVFPHEEIHAEIEWCITACGNTPNTATFYTCELTSYESSFTP